MNNNTSVTSAKKSSSIKKDALCLALVVIAVFILHIFSKNTVDQMYKAKVKDNASITEPAKRVSVF